MLGLFGKHKFERFDFTANEQREFAPLNRQLQRFLDIQHLQLTIGSDVVDLRDDGEKYRYLHFILGAMDFLSRTIHDETKSQTWFIGVGSAQAVALFGKQEKAVVAVMGYGDETTPPDRFNAGRDGWVAMKVFDQSIQPGKTPEDEQNAKFYSLSLSRVVRKY